MTVTNIKPGYGYLQPVSTNSEKNDQELDRFLSNLVSSITGIPGELVRPRWQKEPPNEPDFNVDWAAIGETGPRTRDVFSAEVHVGGLSDGQDIVIRNEILQILCSFYGPNAQANSELLAMGLGLAQNREAMELNGFGLVEVQDSLRVPALIKDRWLWGMDTPIRLRRQQQYTYAVPSLIAAEGVIETSADFDVGFEVLEP